jgi:hypothetical protein
LAAGVRAAAASHHQNTHSRRSTLPRWLGHCCQDR